jgi:hypothetical protein
MSILNLSQITGEEDGKIARIMFSLKDDGIVQWSSDRYGLGTNEPIIYVPKDVRQKSAARQRV